MTLKILIDMNLSPLWVDELKKNNIDAIHWSTVGKPSATDKSVMEWARQNKAVVWTLKKYTTELKEGALLSVDEKSSRIRLLPFSPGR